MFNEVITSSQNLKIKYLDKLYTKSSVRKADGLFVVEGIREIFRAIKSGYILETLYRCSEIMSEDSMQNQNDIKVDENKIIEIGKNVFEGLAYRENSGGMIGVFQSRYVGLEDLRLSENPLILVVEAIEKPGNIGAIFRTADSAKIDAIIICDQKTDIYNPNVIRASVGCVFSVPFVVSTNENALTWLKSKNINLYSASLSATNFYYNVDFDSPSALIVGSEANGLSDFWLGNSQQIKIPMMGIADSLNVSVSTAVILYEAIRQRNFNLRG